MSVRGRGFESWRPHSTATLREKIRDCGWLAGGVLHINFLFGILPASRNHYF
jgi:hypothetical protein